MKTELALKLVSDLMQWKDDQVAATEFLRLGMMIDYKYDHYHGFQPGSRFYVALIGWLGQFKNLQERQVAYEFLTRKLIFVNQREMHHLVSLLMPIVDRALRGDIAGELAISLYQTWTEKAAIARMKGLLRRTLFIGLSDGARMDVFRRYNEEVVSNEQVVAAVEIGPEKWRDLNRNLREALTKAGENDQAKMHFERFCLIDDFTGSGSSLIRKKDGAWKGKVQRFVDTYGEFLKDAPGQPWPVQVHHHLASAHAAEAITEMLREYQKDEPRFEFFTTFSYRLPADIVVSDTSDPALVSLLKAYYDDKIEDEHTGKGIWYGYKQSGLPLILDHNTPNNSVAFLWAQSPTDSLSPTPMKPLFPRRKRHSSHG